MSHDHDHDGTTIVLQDEPVAGGRRGAALMWMGAMLGGMFIAVIFLGFNWYTTYHALDLLRHDHYNLLRDSNTTTASLAREQQVNADLVARRQRDLDYITKMQTQCKRRGVNIDQVAPGYDPFARDWVPDTH